MTRIHTIILVSCIALLLAVPGTVVAQETSTASAPTETTTAAAPPTASESSNETTYFGDVAGDPLLRIVDAEYRDGTAIITLEADAPRLVTVTAPTGSTSAGVASGNIVRRSVPKGRSTIRVASPEPRVTLTTSTSIRNEQYTEIRFEDGSALIAGPFTGTDVRDAAIGGAFGTSFGALLIIVRRRFGLHRGMERVA
ncbi:hypothetical protein C5C07_02875 [Haloferax sp. Atlit-4N]|uniref:hypothetical protein n=1 Tax=Haloferax sp. Atlit-4N TaxID=2077206 RepID=UPI000E26287C|nr:hypothetical protein [Haloferax sp. Atlit-4N]RDZ54487.1 hypothetical protein C5C07_02875 [Haloferax sp. Atlit-4N]